MHVGRILASEFIGTVALILKPLISLINYFFPMLQVSDKNLKDEISQPTSQPIDICFRNITYNVLVEDTESNQAVLPMMKKQKEKTLLNNLSGVMPAGKLTAIMGASGAGKTTLLNVLACRIPLEKASGSITANKSKYGFENFGDFANYVMQQDILMETLTVRETLEFAANLKLNLN
jgi:ABC-type multidrug transport system fused ATPase/permease subunit